MVRLPPHPNAGGFSGNCVHVRLVVIVAVFILGPGEAVLACLISAICSGKPFAGEGVGPLQKAVHTQIAISLLSSFTSFGWPPKRG